MNKESCPHMCSSQHNNTKCAYSCIHGYEATDFNVIRVKSKQPREIKRLCEVVYSMQYYYVLTSVRFESCHAACGPITVTQIRVLHLPFAVTAIKDTRMHHILWVLKIKCDPCALEE